MLDLIGLPALALTVIACVWTAIISSRGYNLIRLPFLMSAVYMAYIIPKLVGLLSSTSFIALSYRHSGTVDVLIISATLCYFGALLGYHIVRPQYGFEERRWTFSARQYTVVFSISSLILLISIISVIELAQTAGGVFSYFFSMDRYTLDWRGAEVYYSFFADLVYVPMFLFGILFHYKKTRLALIFLLISLIYPILNIVILFRRTDVIEVGTVIGFIALVYYRYRPTRLTILISVLFVMAAVLLFPQIRIAKVHKQEIHSETVTDTLDKFAQFDSENEIAMAAFRVQRVRNQGDFGDGAVFWNALVSQFIPRGLVGQAEKNKFYINADRKGYYFYGWSRSGHFYLAPIGFSQAFEEFGYFGFLIFSVFGALMGALERWRTHSFAGELIYVLMLAPAVLGISNDIQIPITKLATYAIILGLLWITGQLSRLRGIRREGETQPTASGRTKRRARPALLPPLARRA